ncbi:hypothetical protein BLNAU_5079 [Blattamonas nauphoetae]|uniref:Uncharacterized protein n=1 Tax=Blattamonas nauphoetae TaxID=2049346 RepID=A0ABQ9Y7Y7_9EUKA|nr:hypothetical protein BLNAU_5079 [Blattamonas nauphoetae]
MIPLRSTPKHQTVFVDTHGHLFYDSIFFNTYFSSCFLSRHHPFTFAPDLLPLTLLVQNTSSPLSPLSSPQSTADTFEKFQFNHSDDIRNLAANPNLTLFNEYLANCATVIDRSGPSPLPSLIHPHQ